VENGGVLSQLAGDLGEKYSFRHPRLDMLERLRECRAVMALLNTTMVITVDVFTDGMR
jgi:hypothetical protein